MDAHSHVGKDNSEIDLWNVDNALLLQTFLGHAGDNFVEAGKAYVYDVVFSPDGKILASAGG